MYVTLLQYNTLDTKNIVMYYVNNVNSVLCSKDTMSKAALIRFYELSSDETAV